jgi:hypothetical protein
MVQHLAVGCLCLGACGGSFSTTGVAEPMSQQVAVAAVSQGGTGAAKASCSDLRSNFASDGSPRPVPGPTVTPALLTGTPTQPHRIAGTLHAVAGDCSLHSEEQMIAELKRLAREVGCDAILSPVLGTHTTSSHRRGERHLEAPCVVYRQ